MASPTRADHNLLFGILALQMDFISRDGLVGAMQAWVLDKAKTLGDLLVEQGHLSPARRDLLNALVAEHLQARGDIGDCLAAAGHLQPIAHELRAIGDPDLQASLVAIKHSISSQSTDPYAPESSENGRYQVLRHHARGGLGEVFVALDRSLNREVALKEIQERYADNAASRSRFVLEAEITGGLEHPGIVPVYDYGRRGDERPYYVMRFIRGESLKEAIRAFHSADVPGRDAGERSLAFRQLLRRFVDACNAVAYAHSRGVLHRDLKPANIMLGPYGETLVVDWGLAKAVGRQESGSGSAEKTLRPASSSLTETIAGTALGTPAYMSPEQASGQLDTLGPATDVYGLGATLYSVLTGEPPVQETESGGMLRRVQRGDIAPPRRINPRTPPSLQAICLKAMALDPSARYADALSLAEDVEHWLADEPVLAHRDPFLARGRRWVRQHQTFVGSAAAAVLVLVLSLATGLGIVSRAYRDEKAARQYAVEQEQEAHRQRISAEERAAQIEQRLRAEQAATEQADALFGARPDNAQDEDWVDVEVRDYYLRRSRKMEGATGSAWDVAAKYGVIAESLRRRKKYVDSSAWYDKARLTYEQLAAERPQEPLIAFDLAELYLGIGLLDADRGDARAAQAWFDKASTVAKGLASDPLERLFDHDADLRLSAAGDAFKAAKDLPTSLAFYQAALTVSQARLQRIPANAQFLLDSADCTFRVGLVKHKLNLPGEALACFDKTTRVLEALSKKQLLSVDARKTLARTYNYAGLVLAAAGNASEALRRHEQAVVLREKLANREARDRAFSLELAYECQAVYIIHRDAKRYQDCQRWSERGAATFDRLAKDYPEFSEYAHARDELRIHEAAARAHQGQYQVATRRAKALRDGARLLPIDFYNLACVFAVSVEQAEADRTLTGTQRKEFVKGYTSEATQLLTRAKAASYFAKPDEVADLKTDPDFQAIRTSPEFKLILASLEGSSRPSSGGAGRGDR